MCVGRHFEKIPFRFAPLHLFCIPAYTHQIPNGISSHLLRDNLYIIAKKFGGRGFIIGGNVVTLW